MTQLSVESVTRGAKSFKVMTSGGTYYVGFKSATGIEQTVGKVIDADVAKSDDGRASFINSFSVVQGAAPSPAAAKTNAMPYWWPSVSNVWAAAIQSGLIKEPKDLDTWANRVRSAATGDAPF